MCRTPDDVKFFGRAPLGDPTAGMTDSEQAAYWRASRDRMAAQAMEAEARVADEIDRAMAAIRQRDLAEVKRADSERMYESALGTLTKALEAARTLVIAYKAHERDNSRKLFCGEILDQIDAALPLSRSDS